MSAAVTANNLAATMLFLTVYNRPPFIGASPPKAPPHLPNQSGKR
ncbi:MAG TPA: hypothetical protein VF740_10040 [Candidatus Acidoferrum sp.]